jgi:hypothetical protein
MADISHWTRVLKGSITLLFSAALAGTLVVIVAADTASAETLKHLQTQLNKQQKVRAGSLPGHPDQDIRRPTLKVRGFMRDRKPPPPNPTVTKLPSDHSDQLPRCSEHPGTRAACR